MKENKSDTPMTYTDSNATRWTQSIGRTDEKDDRPERARTAEEYLIRKVCELEEQNKTLEYRNNNLNNCLNEEIEQLWAVINALGLKVTKEGYLFSRQIGGVSFTRDSDTLNTIQYLRSIGLTDEEAYCRYVRDGEKQ